MQLLGVILIAGVGSYLVMFSRAATPPATTTSTSTTYSAARTGDSTFKLFAPGWRYLGGKPNVPNVQYFTQIFSGSPASTLEGLSPGTKVYKYTLGPYVGQKYVPCNLIPEGTSWKNTSCGKGDSGAPNLPALPKEAVAIGVNTEFASFANDFDNNILVVPDHPKTKENMKGDAAYRAANFDGILSDSMGEAPLSGNYVNNPPRFPGTNRVYTDSEWLTAQKQLLGAKKEGLGAKSLIINGLAKGQVYFQPVSAKMLITDKVDGAMAERIFREPNDKTTEWRPQAQWKQDVDMIVDVQNMNKLGFWWTKCWSMEKRGGNPPDTCTLETGNVTERITQVRRHAIASYLLGAGSKSYFNFDQDKLDTVEGEPNSSNAAEWYGNDYTKAMQVGLATGNYVAAGGGMYKRSFSNGIVVVNPTGGAQTLSVGGAKYKDFDDVTRTGNFSVPANTGMVLRNFTDGGPAGDTVPPAVYITTPKEGASLTGTITATGTATDNVGVTKVELLVDGVVRGSDPTNPISISWDTKTIGDGAHKLSLKAYDAAGNVKISTVINVTIANTTPPPNPTITSLVANPATIIAGNRSTLKWTTTSTKTCAITPGGPAATTALSWTTPIMSTVGTKSYTLTCVNSVGKTVAKTVSLTINKAPTPPGKPTLAVSPATVKRGGSATFTWSSTNATSCKLQPGNFTASGSAGSRVVTKILNTTAYTIVCSNNVGSSTSDVVTVTVSAAPPVLAPVITSFTAEPTQVEAGGTSTLRWTTTNVMPGGCSLKPSPLKSTDPNGQWTTPELNTSVSYTLTCVNSAKASVHRSVSVVVNDIPAPEDPEPEYPEPEYDWGGDEDDWGSLDDEEISIDVQDEYGESTTVEVDNGAVLSQVKGLLTLDPTNLTDKEKLANIQYVEYYVDDELLKTVNEPPFALDTTLLENGQYTITERVYYIDGSTSEVTKVVDIANDEAAAGSSAGGAKKITKKKTLLKKIAFYVGVAAIAASAIGLIVLFVKFIRYRKEPKDTVSPSLSPYNPQEDHFFMEPSTLEPAVPQDQPTSIVTPSQEASVPGATQPPVMNDLSVTPQLTEIPAQPQVVTPTQPLTNQPTQIPVQSPQPPTSPPQPIDPNIPR